MYQLNKPQEMIVEVRKIKSTNYSLLIIDNLFEDPISVRNYALSMNYEPLGANNPGARAAENHFFYELGVIVQKQIGEEYGWSTLNLESVLDKNYRFHRMPFPSSTCPSEIDMPHIDSIMLAGLTYLNLPSQCCGGTDFYRHKSTGVHEWKIRTKDRIATPVIEAVLKLGFEEVFRNGVASGNWKDIDHLRNIIFEETIKSKDFLSEGSNAWSKIDSISMKWNRFICFPGFLFHSSNIDHKLFGTDTESCRLIQNFLFNWPLEHEDIYKKS